MFFMGGEFVLCIFRRAVVPIGAMLEYIIGGSWVFVVHFILSFPSNVCGV